MYGCESWTIKNAEHQRIDPFELWCWIKLLRVPWNARRSNQSILKEINPEYLLEGLMLKLKLLFWPRDGKSWLIAFEGRKRRDNRGWDGWMASPTQWAWVWASSRRWWRTGKAGMLKFMGSQRVRHKWPSEQQHHMRRCSNSLLKGIYFHHQGIGLKWIILLNVLILGS